MNDLISRQAVEDAMYDATRSMDLNYGQIMEYIDKLPSVKPQEPKILETLDFAIDASNGDTNYFVGFRNGLRYSKSLIDGKEPQFESCTEQEPKTGHWIETAEEYYKAVNEYGGGVNENTPYFVDDIACSECLAKYSVIDNETERFDHCPSCGAKMVESQERSE